MSDERLPLLEPPKPEKKSVLLTVCPYILGNELCERLAYYGLATNLVTYLTRTLGGDPAFAAIIVAIFEGTCYTTPIIGAILADSKWGRYKTIIVFSVIYLIGIIALTGSTLLPDNMDDAEANPAKFYVLFASLGVISLGTGGIKPNVSAFGADQFNEADPRDRREKESFFNWFYLAVNVGSLIASIVIVYIQDSVSWTLGFGIPGVCMAAAIGLFWAGRAGYRHVVPTESPMTRVVKVVAAAMSNRWKRKHSGASSPVGAPRVVAGEGASDGDSSSLHGGDMAKQRLRSSAHGGGNGANGEAGLPRSDSLLQMPLNASMSYRWLEDAVTEWQTSQGQVVTAGGLAGYTPKQVEEVKLVLRLLPIFAATVLYWTIYTQMGTLFVQQGTLMAREFSWKGQTLVIPSASMSTFNTLSIIVLIWVYDAFLEPALKKSQRFRMTMLRRQGWGMVVAAIAMLYAGCLEEWRLSLVRAEDGATCPPECQNAAGGRGLLGLGLPDGYAGPAPGAPLGMPWLGWPVHGLRALLGLQGGAADPVPGPQPDHCAMLCAQRCSELNIFWQAPSYFLIGLSEVFTSIGQLEFFYDQAPDVMRSCSMALCLLSTALGSYSAGALTAAVQAASAAIWGESWLPRDLNKGHMDYFFYALAVLMVLNLGWFLIVAMRYEYKAVEHKRHVQPGDADTLAAQQAAAVAAAAAYAPPVTANVQAPTMPPGLQQPGAGGLPYIVGAGPQYASQPLAIGGRQYSATAPVPMGTARLGAAAGDEDPASMEIYSRSLAYVPNSPNIPAPFR